MSRCECWHRLIEHSQGNDWFCLRVGCDCESYPTGKSKDSMSPQAETHLKEIKEQAVALIDAKYRRGFQEHSSQGGLWTLKAIQLIDEAIQEVIDLLTYLLELKKKLKEGV